MARTDRPQWARLDFDGVGVLADLAAGTSLARPVRFDAGDLRCFDAPASASVPLEHGDARYAVAQGAPCNCNVLTLVPHAHGTHTESVGHLTREPLDAWQVIPQRLLPAVVVSVTPQVARESAESTEPRPADEDRLVTQAALEAAWPRPPAARLAARAAVIRTLPTGAAGAAPVPFLSRQAAEGLVARGIMHLVLDLPSADRLDDGGALTAHRAFFGLPPASHALADAQRPDHTLTELARIDEAIVDGWYLLSLQAPAIGGDAVPSRPVLYPLRLG